jgi:hypothetical protein
VRVPQRGGTPKERRDVGHAGRVQSQVQAVLDECIDTEDCQPWDSTYALRLCTGVRDIMAGTSAKAGTEAASATSGPRHR